MGAFPVWRPNLDELDVDSAPASAFLILKSFKIIPLQLSCRVPARVLACLLCYGPGAPTDDGQGAPVKKKAGIRWKEPASRTTPASHERCEREKGQKK